MASRFYQSVWVLAQGDRVCDVCKATIANLPELPPRSPTAAGSDAGGSWFDGDADDRIGGHHPNGLHPSALGAEQMPGFADVIFDCIRVRFRDERL